MSASTILRRCFFAGVAACSAACSSNPAQRPLPPEPEPVSHTISFAPTSTNQIFTPGDRASASLTLIRENPASAPDEIVDIKASARKGSVSAPESVDFKAGLAEISFSIEYYGPSLSAGDTDFISISAGKINKEIIVTRVAGESSKATYIRNFERLPVSVTRAGDTYIVSGDDFNRTISLADNTPHIISDGDFCDITDARNRLIAAQSWVPYIYNAASTYDSGEGRFNIIVADNNLTPSIEYLITQSDSEWVDCGITTFTDPWVLPVVSLNAELLDPDRHPWRVWLQQSTTKPGMYRVIDLYRGDCPLMMYNDAPAGTVLLIDATDPDAVTIAPDSNQFSNPDIAPITVSGLGQLQHNEKADVIYISSKAVFVIEK